VLWISWDPISGAPDEYVRYSSDLLRLLSSGATDREVAAALGQLRIEQLGASPSSEADLRVARSTQDWYQWFIEGSDPPELDR
jgi:hypothetical protein